MSGSDGSAGAARLIWSGVTDKGRFRKNNEDAFLALTFNAHEVQYLGKIGEATVEKEDFIFAVSDGMGGAKAGEFASRIAVQKIAEMLPKHYRKYSLEAVDAHRDLLENLFMKVHMEMQMMGQHYEECKGMGATLSLGWFTLGRMYFAHVGDSRIYLVSKSGGFRQLTEDDTRVGALYRKGLINEREARTHPERHMLDKVLGGGSKGIVPQVGWVDYKAGDYFVFCSDGVIDGVWDRGIKDLILEPNARFAEMLPANRLMREAYESSGRDNITAVVVEVS